MSADPSPPLRRTYNPQEVARVAGLSLDEVEWLIKTGRLRAVRLADGGARILHSAVVRFLESGAADTNAALAERYASYAATTRAAIDIANEQCNDQGTGDMFIDIVRDIDKSLWFLEAHLQA